MDRYWIGFWAGLALLLAFWIFRWVRDARNNTMSRRRTIIYPLLTVIVWLSISLVIAVNVHGNEGEARLDQAALAAGRKVDHSAQVSGDVDVRIVNFPTGNHPQAIYYDGTLYVRSTTP